MNKIIHYTFCFFLLSLLCNTVLAQRNAGIALEAGLGKGIGAERQKGYSSPYVQPLIGLHYVQPLGKRWDFEFGLQYQSRADKYKKNFNQGDDAIRYDVAFKSKFRVDRLMLPTSFGYSFHSKNWTFTTHLGHRFAWLLGGIYKTKWEGSTNLIPQTEVVEGQVHPFTNDRYVFKVIEYINLGKSRMYYQNQYFCSFGAKRKDHLEFLVAAYFYRELKVLDDPLSQIPVVNYGNSMQIAGSELLFSMRYHFPIRRNKHKLEDQ